MYVIETQNLTLKYEQRKIIENLDVNIHKNKITTLVGSNGCGKSTLLKSFARLLSPSQGKIILDGKNIHLQKSTDVAKKLAILPQTPISPEGLSVYQLVKMGRYPHQIWLQQWSQHDEDTVNQALKDTDTYALRDQLIDALSGGQRQRVWIAMTLAQDSDTILLDEPTTYLDLSHQIDILDLLSRLNKTYKKTIIMVLHDLNLACRYSHELICVYQKGIFAHGQPQDIISESLIKTVFNLNCKIIDDPYFNTPLCIPFSK